MAEIEAKIGNWYQTAEGEVFEVVAMEGDAIEIQYFEGEVAELDQESWEQMFLSEIDAPEDWTGAYDELERDDLGYSDGAIHPESWSGPLTELDLEK